MLISATWLSSFLGDELPPPERTAELVTGLGLEVDGIEEVGAHTRHVRVAEVRSVAPHPNANRLRIVRIFDGERELDIVCGAPNVPDPGGKVAFAPVGTELPGGLRIEAREIRGVPSAGMLCSEAELDLGPDENGILVLEPDAPAGRPLAEYVPGAHDVIFELSVTPNRPDALGHVGVARDLAAKLACPLRLPETIGFGEVAEQPDLVTLEAPDACGRYFGVALEGAKVGPSPLEARVRLHRLGLRPISAPVDITNLVLLEWGQPLHVFDRERLKGGVVRVRRARGGERIEVLDGRTLTLCEDDLVIADAEDPVALAGIMGGAASAVQSDTTRLLLEAAWFRPAIVRKAARRHQIASDSSHRFERGVDHGFGLERAAARAFDLLRAWTGARPVARCEVRGEVPATPRIRFRARRCTRLLGISVSVDEAQEILGRLGVAVERESGGDLVCTPPTHRPDLQREVDLFEEVLRLKGLDAIEARSVVPSKPMAAAMPNLPRRLRRDAQDALAARGLLEIVGWAFRPDADFAFLDDVVPPARRVRLKNPLREEPTVMRPHLLPGLLAAASNNAARGARRIRLFEVGRVYTWPAGDGPNHVAGPVRLGEDDRLADERQMAGVLVGVPSGDVDVLRGVGDVCLHVLERLGYTGSTSAPPPGPLAGFHPGLVGAVRLADGRWIARYGAVHPDLVAAYDLGGWTLAYGEIDLWALGPPEVRKARPIPNQPGSSRDLSLAVPPRVHAAEIRDWILTWAQGRDGAVRLDIGDAGEPPVEVVEEYRGEGGEFEGGRRAVLFRLHYRADGRTVRDDEVDALHETLVAALLAAFGDDPRGPLRRR